MPQPFDYTIRPQNPNTGFLQGLNTSSKLIDMARNFQIEKAQAQAAKAQAERQAVINEAMSALAQNENPTAQDYIKVAGVLPKEQAEGIRKNWELLSTEKQNNQKKFASQVFAAFDGAPEIGINLLKERAEAERNSGNDKSAQAYDTWAQIAELNPKMAQKQIGIMIAGLPGGEEVLEGVSKVGGELRTQALQAGTIKKQAADLGLTSAQTNKALANTKKLGVETQKSVLELEAMKKGEIVDPEKIFNMENTIRNDYNKRTAGYKESQRNLSIITESALDHSGAGDIALVTSFMKMLDPGSVVRETEFANARNTAGLLANLRNKAQKLATGAFLDPTQRNAFSRLAEKYMEASEKQEGQVRKDLDFVIKNYELNPENIFGERAGLEDFPAFTPKEDVPEAIKGRSYLKVLKSGSSSSSSEAP